MLNCFIQDTEEKIIPIVPICQDDFSAWLDGEPLRVKNIVSNNKFLAKPGGFCLLIDNDGNLEKVFLGIKEKDDLFSFGALPKALPKGCYNILAEGFSPEQLEKAAIGWGMGSYQFDRYKKPEELGVVLLCRESFNLGRLNTIVSSIFLVRDLINTPAGDLYPEKLAEVTANLANEFQADLKVIKGEELAAEFPAVHAVGKASKNKPVLIDLTYGDPKNTKIVLVGKGVCFDSGGLQIKPSSAMPSMKKDMAGAAHSLGLARMIMGLKLPVNLRVIIPAVENLISGDELKPGDVIKTRKGITLEIANTDAEGRLILADALTLASEWQPELILDFATLTGAAHVALGSDIVALFANDDQVAAEIIENMEREGEPVWQMPLYQPYLEALKSELADLRNIPVTKNIGGGAITAALILQQFVTPEVKWAHFDMYAYNDVNKPAKPKGGEAMCLRGVFSYLEKLLVAG